MASFDAVTGKWISQIQYASEDAIKHQADPIRRSLRALFTALKLMRESPRDAAEICSKKLGWPPEAVLRAHRISGPLLPVDGRIDVAALGVMQGTLLEYDVIKKKLPLEDHFTREFTPVRRSEEHTSELQSLAYLVCRLLLEKKKLARLRAVLGRGRVADALRLSAGDLEMDLETRKVTHGGRPVEPTGPQLELLQPLQRRERP